MGLGVVLPGTERLVIREFDGSDWPATQAHESDPDVVRHEPFGPYTPEESRTYMRQVIAWAAETPRQILDLAVVLRANDRLIGRCGLGITHTENREGMVWYILNRQVQERLFGGLLLRIDGRPAQSFGRPVKAPHP